MTQMNIPFAKPDISQAEIDEVAAVLKSGWLTTGARAKRFEQGFIEATGGKYAVALNSCTAALHLAVEALGLKAGQGVLVPTLTFAATAEVVRYVGAVPIMVDSEPNGVHMDLADAETRLALLREGKLPGVPSDTEVVGIIPVHKAGIMMNMRKVNEFAAKHNLWVVEDAAHSFPAAWRENAGSPWIKCGQNASRVACFSFYANKTITTGEGGMAVTDDEALADRMRVMSLHGLSQDAWKRYSDGKQKWDYRIVAPGFKYNLTDIAAAVGVHQLARAEQMRKNREAIVLRYFKEFGGMEQMELPYDDADRIHAWHLFEVKLNLDKLTIDRNAFFDELRARGVGCSVHWRPLHLHTYYELTYGCKPEGWPVATSLFDRIISLPLFSGMTEDETDYVVKTVKDILTAASK